MTGTQLALDFAVPAPPARQRRRRPTTARVEQLRRMPLLYELGAGQVAGRGCRVRARNRRRPVETVRAVGAWL